MADNEPFAYRLEVRVEPQWAEIIRRVVGLRDEKEQREFGARIVLQDDRILHRNYDFTEFFDTQTGLTTKFQSAHFNGKTYSRFVKEFCDSGYLFGRDSPLMPMAGDPQYQIAITESSIGTHCFDPHGGQLDLTGPKLSKFQLMQ
jgi:hypothetical protein